jgi:hypothetical protein
VDGVLSLYSAASAGPDAVVGTLVDGVPHLLSRPAGAALRSLAEVYECVWCTGWEDRADEHLPGLLDLPRGWPHVAFPDRPEIKAHWKLAGIDAFAGRERALAWIDDAHDEDCRAWARARPGPTLLVTCAPDEGLTAGQAETLRAWAARLDGRR